MVRVIRATSSVPTTATARRYPTPSLNPFSLNRDTGHNAALTDADGLLAFMSHQSSSNAGCACFYKQCFGTRERGDCHFRLPARKRLGYAFGCSHTHKKFG